MDGGPDSMISGSPITAGAVIMIAMASFVVFILNRPKKLNLPVMGKPGSEFYGNDILEGTIKVDFIYPPTYFVPILT